MKTNLIQNFIHTQNTQPSKKEAPDFDIHHELANKTFIKPLKGQGRLIKSNILYAPVEMAKSFAYDVNALKGSIKGEANDHQLGKLNDLGMKIGGLGIAGFLFTKRQTPLTKTMEFVGLGSFFASMALWPKIAIQLPARLIHGFNVQQQYEDSFGRKKPFYQDAQFLPWDLYSAKEIDKIGDRMGVPKDIPNRRDFIQEKMKKIAIQNNTLWMLTAGFATPIMSALICNQLEKPLAKPLAAHRNNENNYIINKFKDASKGMISNEIKNKTEKIISVNQNKPLTKDLLNELADAISTGFDPRVKKIIAKDLGLMLQSSSSVINDNAINSLVTNTKKAFLDKGIATEIVDSLIPEAEQLRTYFAIEQGSFGNEITKDNQERIFQTFTKDIRSKMLEYNKSNPNKEIDRATQKKIIQLLTAPADKNPIYQALTKERYAILDSKNQKLVRTVTNIMNEFKGEVDAMDKYVLQKVGQVAETTLANSWNKTVDMFVKNLRITPQQIAETRGDRLLTTELLHTSLDNLTAEKPLYKKITTDLINQIMELDRLIKKTEIDDGIFSNPEEICKLDKRLEQMFQNFETKLGNITGKDKGDMETLLDYMVGPRRSIDIPERAKKWSVKNLYKSMAKERLFSVKSTFFRMLNTLDTYRRVAIGDTSYMSSLKELPRELKEEVVELSKGIGLSAHTADYLTKFFASTNPNPNWEDMSDIKLVNGKTVYKYFHRSVEAGKVNQPFNSKIFIDTMGLTYKDPISDETEKAFGKNKALLNEFKEYRNQSFRKLGTYNYIENTVAKVGDSALPTSDKEMFNLLGAAMDEVVSNYGKQAYNTRKWMNIFAPAGAVLLGITVLSQFFFGRMNPPSPIAKTDKGQINA